MIIESIKKFAASSAAIERAAWDIYERLPMSIRYRIFHGPAFFSWLTLLKESEHWDRDKLHTFQFEQTKSLLIHAAKYVPYYRNLFLRFGFQPDRFQSFNDLAGLPYVGKEDVRDARGEFIDEHVPRKSLVTKLTGGSSGIPLTVYRSRESYAAFLAFRVNILGRVGHTPKSREVMLWHDLRLGNKSFPYVRYGNKLVFSMKYLDEKLLLQHMDMIRQFKPEYLLGYPSALTVFAAAAKQNKASLSTNLKAVIPYAETLRDWQRELMEESFGSRVFSMYAMSEYTAIGGECETSSGMHFHPLYGLMEFADSVFGYKEIVATGFTNYAMPFIRYRTGDLVSSHSPYCTKCGRRHIVTGNIEGKSHEFLVGKNGDLIHIWPMFIAGFPNMLQYQFYQDEPGRAYLKIVPSATFSKADMAYIREQIDKFLGPGTSSIDLAFIIVDHIKKTPSGKVSWIEQKLDVQKSLL